jgi:hypothetical protein
MTSRNQHVHTRRFLISKKHSSPTQTHGINGPTPISTFGARLATQTYNGFLENAISLRNHDGLGHPAIFEKGTDYGLSRTVLSQSRGLFGGRGLVRSGKRTRSEPSHLAVWSHGVASTGWSYRFCRRDHSNRRRLPVAGNIEWLVAFRWCQICSVRSSRA